eukprot:scaffold10860_cov182-Amphora_coffeaeformis.AAC.11
MNFFYKACVMRRAWLHVIILILSPRSVLFTHAFYPDCSLDKYRQRLGHRLREGQRYPKRSRRGRLAPSSSLFKNDSDDFNENDDYGAPSSILSSRSRNLLELMNLAVGHGVSQCLQAFVRHGLPESLFQNGAQTARDLAMERGLEVAALERVLRLLAFVGILDVQSKRKARPNHGIDTTTETDDTETTYDSYYSLTNKGKLLVEEPGLSGMVLHWMEDPLWNTWGSLGDSLLQVSSSDSEKGVSAFKLANHGQSPADHYSHHATSLQHSNSFVSFLSQWETRAVVECFDWSSVTRVVDLGGHNGALVAAIHKEYPNVQAICLDLPLVVQRYKQQQRQPLFPNVTLVKGNFFDAATIPANADVLLLKHVVFCDWNDDDSLAILRACHQALPASGGRVVIAEAVLPEGSSSNSDNSPSFLAYYYMDVLLMASGRDDSPKTESQWKRAAQKTDFRVERILYTGVPSCSLVVLRKQQDR